MLEKLLSPLTTATSLGVAVRYLTTIVGSIIPSWASCSF